MDGTRRHGHWRAHLIARARTLEWGIIAISAVVIALLVVQTVALRHEVRILDSLLSSTQGKLTAARNDVTTMRSDVDKVKAQQAHEIDVGKVARAAAPSVFTVRAGPASGSGFAAFHGGNVTFVVTNAHVVRALMAGGSDVVQLEQDGGSRSAHVVRVDDQADVALIALDDPDGDVPVLANAFAHRHDPVEGDPVVAYGTPLGVFNDTVTQGVISALRHGVIQTDAQVHPGNSGGPLLNRFGEVIGVVTAEVGDRANRTGGSGLSFALDFRFACGVMVQFDPSSDPCRES